MAAKLSFKRLGLLFAIALPLAVITYCAVFWSEIQYGLKLPGRVGTAADQYFHDSQQLEAAFNYHRFLLPDGSEWKVVSADTNGERSIPSWLIVLAQGPGRQTYVLEQSFDYNRMYSLNRIFTYMRERQAQPEVALSNAERLQHADARYLELYQAPDSARFAQVLEALGFRKTSY